MTGLGNSQSQLGETGKVPLWASGRKEFLVGEGLFPVGNSNSRAGLCATWICGGSEWGLFEIDRRFL